MRTWLKITMFHHHYSLQIACFVRLVVKNHKHFQFTVTERQRKAAKPQNLKGIFV